MNNQTKRKWSQRIREILYPPPSTSRMRRYLTSDDEKRAVLAVHGWCRVKWGEARNPSPELPPRITIPDSVPQPERWYFPDSDHPRGRHYDTELFTLSEAYQECLKRASNDHSKLSD